jgi:drug/metabolite transporter (DMT)-like permease
VVRGRIGGRDPRLGLHVGALALAPLSIVQAVLSGGLVFLAVLAEGFFEFKLGRWQWFGVVITAAGLAVIGQRADRPRGRAPVAAVRDVSSRSWTAAGS